jgi:hypothetical protein
MQASSCLYPKLVDLTVTQIETFFGELGYIELRLKVLGVLGVLGGYDSRGLRICKPSM